MDDVVFQIVVPLRIFFMLFYFNSHHQLPNFEKQNLLYKQHWKVSLLGAIDVAVSIRNGDMDDGWTTARMILAGVPLSEPHLQDRLAKLANFERKSLKEGKLPISESFYVMGTADPTGLLKANEVCVILYVDYLVSC